MARRALIRLGLMRPPLNLLRNADFGQCTSEGIPDYWGSGVAADVIDARGAFTITGDGPVTGSRVLRLTNRWPGTRLFVQSAKTFVPKPQPYTFSVYLRADARNVPVGLGIGWAGDHPVTTTRNWQRHVVTYTPSLESRSDAGLAVTVSLSAPGAIEIAAPQLESGDRATTFDVALMDDHPLPVVPWPETDVTLDARAVNASARPAWMGGGRLAFGIAVADLTDVRAADIAGRGFDAVVVPLSLQRSPGSDELAQTFQDRLDVARRHSLRVIPMMGGKDLTLDESRAVLAPAVARWKGDPAIAAWMIYDEPSRHFAQPPWPELRALYQAARAADPDHPAFINDNAWSAASSAARLEATDIASIDGYPVGSYQNPLALVSGMVRAMNADAVRAGKPSACWLQLYGWNDVPREPTPDELRAMAYTVFIWGTRLLLFWDYKPLNAALWRSVGALRREMGEVAQTVDDASSRWLKSATAARCVQYGVWERAGVVHVVACNAAPERVSASLDLGGAGPAAQAHVKARFPGAQAAFDAGKLHVRFEPYERQMFEVAA